MINQDKIAALITSKATTNKSYHFNSANKYSVLKIYFRNIYFLFFLVTQALVYFVIRGQVNFVVEYLCKWNTELSN